MSREDEREKTACEKTTRCLEKIAECSSMLSFKGRISDDNWV